MCEVCTDGGSKVFFLRVMILVPTLGICFLLKINHCPNKCKLRLAIHVLLSGEWEALCAFFAVVCSSYVPVNRASTGRSIMTPLGNQDFIPVRKSNILTSRRGWYGL